MMTTLSQASSAAKRTLKPGRPSVTPLPALWSVSMWMAAICTEKPLPPHAALSHGSSMRVFTVTLNSTWLPLSTTSSSVMSNAPGLYTASVGYV